MNPILVAGLLVTLFALPAHASAPCTDESTVTSPDGNLFVYVGDSVEVWEQSNILPGLQRAPCDAGNGRDLAADTQIL